MFRWKSLVESPEEVILSPRKRRFAPIGLSYVPLETFLSDGAISPRGGVLPGEGAFYPGGDVIC